MCFFQPSKHRGDQRRAGGGMSRNCPRQAYFALGSETKKNPFFMAMPLEDYYDKIKLAITYIRKFTYRNIPLKFIINCRGKREYPPVSLLKLQRMIDTNRLDASKPIDLVSLQNTHLCTCKPSINHFGFNLTEEVSPSIQSNKSPGNNN